MRVADPALFAPPIVITGAAFRFFARRQAEDVGIEATVVIEPATVPLTGPNGPVNRIGVATNAP